MSYDISEIQPNEKTVDIHNPQNGDVVIKVTIMSPDDKRMKPAIRKIQDRALQLTRRNKSPKPEELEQNEVEILAAAITKWEWQGDYGFEGEQVEFSRPVAEKILKKLTWFKEELDENVADTKAFFQK